MSVGTALSSSHVLGARLLGEVEADECTLEDILTILRSRHADLELSIRRGASTNINDTVSYRGATSEARPQHGIPYGVVNPAPSLPSPSRLYVTGRYMPLIYRAISSMLHGYAYQTRLFGDEASRSRPDHGPGGIVVVIDVSSQFRAKGLLLHDTTADDLRFVYIFRVTLAQVRSTLQGLHAFMLREGARDANVGRRVWMGTVLIGVTIGRGAGDSASVPTDVNQAPTTIEEIKSCDLDVGKVVLCASWKGRLNVQREGYGYGGSDGGRYQGGISAQEAIRGREAWWQEIKGRGWRGGGEAGWLDLRM